MYTVCFFFVVSESDKACLVFCLSRIMFFLVCEKDHCTYENSSSLYLYYDPLLKFYDQKFPLSVHALKFKFFNGIRGLQSIRNR